MNQFLLARRTPADPSRLHQGFTLLELLVSLAIGLVILTALVAMFVNTSNRNREMERTNGMIESGRLAVQVLANDIIHTGYWGFYSPQFDDQTIPGVPSDTPTAVPDACLAYASWDAAHVTNLIGIAIQASDSAAICAGVVADKLPGTDVLVVRHADTCVPGDPAPCQGDVIGNLYFQASQCNADVYPFVLDVLDAGATKFVSRARNCSASAERRKFVSNIYYIRDFAVTKGDGIPTLVRSQFDGLVQQAPVALIEGIEGFDVEFGVDDLSKSGEPVDYTKAIIWDDPTTRTTPKNRGDGSPDGNYVHCTTALPCNAEEMMNVTAVKLYVLARSREPSQGYTDTKTYAMAGGSTKGAFNDGFKRHLFVTTIRLPNYAGRRMTP
jgi:type IV pilus assembly protein PilW